MVKSPKKTFYSSTQKKSIIVKTSKEKAWRKISDIAGLAKWVIGVKNTIYLSKAKRGVGAIRKITLDDGKEIEEHVVGWKNKEYFSYVATSGLPLRAYHATISINPISKNSQRIIWQSYFNSVAMTKNEFYEFVKDLGIFYQDSLKNLKANLEK